MNEKKAVFDDCWVMKKIRTFKFQTEFNVINTTNSVPASLLPISISNSFGKKYIFKKIDVKKYNI